MRTWHATQKSILLTGLSEGNPTWEAKGVPTKLMTWPSTLTFSSELSYRRRKPAWRFAQGNEKVSLIGWGIVPSACAPIDCLFDFQDMSVVSDQGIMKIVIPDEKNGSIVTRTLPIRPATTTREVCKMMAHKLKVTNPQDYGLYKLVDGLGTS